MIQAVRVGLLLALPATLGFALTGPTYTKIHGLTAREGVFAYSRISPDGSRLVYASNIGRELAEPQLMVIHLATGRTLWTGRGVDGWWSPDGARIIYKVGDTVMVRNIETGEVFPNPGLERLGDYYSWAERDGKDLILTVQGNYYNLHNGRVALPHSRVASCPALGGPGDRPLISHDGRHITVFVKGNVVVRDLDSCDDIFNTGLQGAKADFSWDGRYIAFHAVNLDGSGYEIRIVDLTKRTVRTVAMRNGSALFPSWTKDGRLCFRYDGTDYRGFMMASGVLDLPAMALGSAFGPSLSDQRGWPDIFPGTPTPKGLKLVLVWAPWSAHSRSAFDGLEQARKFFATRLPEFSVAAAADPMSYEGDVVSQIRGFKVNVQRLMISPRALSLTEARNQMPTTLLFRDGRLIDRRLGAQSFDELREWVQSALSLK